MPNGQQANEVDRVMLLALWVKHLQSQSSEKEILFAGMGNPTFPINHDIASHEVSYWNDVQKRSIAAREVLSETHRATVAEAPELRNRVAEINGTIPYGHPQGQEEARRKIAIALNSWYAGLAAEAKDLILPVGGAGALYAIFEFLNTRRDPKGVIVTPVPFYSLYQGNKNQNKLHPIHVMQEPGYKLTAHALEESLRKAKVKKLPVNAFLFCDPNNPLGTVTDKSEWEKIASILREFLAHEKDFPAEQRTPIILDEAYAEMGLSKKPVSLLTVAPDLWQHFILMRSATKGLSAAGERMALIFSRNEFFIKECLAPGINIYGHAPISAQESFAAGLSGLNKSKLAEMAAYYKPQLELVEKRARAMGVNMPDEQYHPEGTFYILLDLSDLIGQPLTAAAQRAVGEKDTIETDQDICYHLLFDQDIMICPASYFGLNPKNGVIRVTCSGGDIQLNKIMDRILGQILKARESKRKELIKKLMETRAQVSKAVPDSDAAHQLEEELVVTNRGFDLISQASGFIRPHSPLHEVTRRESASSLSSNGSLFDDSGSALANGSCSSSPSDSLPHTHSIPLAKMNEPENDQREQQVAKEQQVAREHQVAKEQQVAKDLKKENKDILKLLKECSDFVQQYDPNVKKRMKETSAALTVQATFRGYKERKKYQDFQEKKVKLKESFDVFQQQSTAVLGKSIVSFSKIWDGIKQDIYTECAGSEPTAHANPRSRIATAKK